MVVTHVIVRNSEKECILSEFNWSGMVFLSVVFFSLHVCRCPFPATDRSFSSMVVTHVIVRMSEKECILSEFNYSLFVFNCCIYLFACV